MVPNVHFILLENSRLKKRLFAPVSSVVTSTHLLDHLAVLPLGKNAASVRGKGHFARRILILKSALKSAEGSQVAAMERETAPNHNVHTYFGFAELNTVFDTPKKFGSLITVKIVGKNVQTKQILVQRLPSSPMN